MSTALIYAEFAAREARGSSPAYESLSVGVSEDHAVLALLDGLPPAKRQPNLLFAVVRFLGGPVEDPATFLAFTAANWPAIAPQMLTRATQTNEIGRCALLLPVLATLPQPLALLEVGTSAGLNLYPDRYSYRYKSNPPGGSRRAPNSTETATPDDHRLGSGKKGDEQVPDDYRLGPGEERGEPVLECAAIGIPPPVARPRVVWRAGLDLNPLDVTDPADLAWLNALIWPEHEHRRARLHAAARIAAADPPLLVRGDLVDDLPALAAEAPSDATLVVFHTSVLYQVPAERRTTFIDLVRDLPAHWIAVEHQDILGYADLPNPPDETLHNVLSLDDRPLAWTRPHGQGLTWFAQP